MTDCTRVLREVITVLSMEDLVAISVALHKQIVGEDVVNQA